MKSKKKKEPYNKGDAYEEKIVKIMKRHGIVPKHFHRAGAGGGTDAIFVHHGKQYNLELKKDLFADYGQKMLTWSKSTLWTWRVDDEVTRFYTDLGVLDHVNAKNIVPKKHQKEDSNLTFKDKKEDQKNFEDKTILIDQDALIDLYRIKNVFYMQIGEGYGFYSLSADPANFGAPQFTSSFVLRLRAKTIHSEPVHHYGFYAVLKPKGKPTRSPFNLERSSKQRFPEIIP